MSARRTPTRELRGAGGASRTAIYAPDASLSGVVLAYLSRATTASAALRTTDRWNYFPPVPACVFVWILDGHDSRLEDCDRAPTPPGERLPVLFSGPHPTPSSSVNRGPVRFFTVLMYPDAVFALTGLPIGPQVGRYTRLQDLFDADWCTMAGEVLRAHDDAARIGLIEAFLHERCRATATRLPALGDRRHRLDAWSVGIDRRARGAMLSPRQSDRRIKTWTGLTLRGIRGIGRMERTLVAAQSMARTGRTWSAIAADCGFADQAHLCREFRRHLGMRPTDLTRRLTEESGWVLRVWT